MSAYVCAEKKCTNYSKSSTHVHFVFSLGDVIPPSPAPFLPFYTKEVKIIVLARFHMNLKGIWQNLLRIATADSLLFKLNRGLSHPVGPAMLYFRVPHIVLDIKSISILLAVQQSIGIHV